GWTCRRRRSPPWRSEGCPSEVAFPLAVFHRGFRGAVVGPGGPALGDPGGRDLLDDLLDRGGRGRHGARAGHVADGAVAHHGLEERLVVAALDDVAVGQEHAVALEDLARVGDVDGRDLDALAADVVPHVELGPVGQREDPDVLALADARVVKVPQLGALVLRVPLAELVAEGEDPLLGPGLLLVAPGAAEDGVDLVLLDRVEQRHGLEPVAGGPPAGVLGYLRRAARLLPAAHSRPDSGLR